MLFENGYALKETDNSDIEDKNIGPVIEVFHDAASRARSLYSRTIENLSSDQDNKYKANIVAFNSERLEKLDLIMSNEEPIS